MDLGLYSKAIAASVMALLTIVEVWTGWKAESITEEWIISILAFVTPILVWLIPNRGSSDA